MGAVSVCEVARAGAVSARARGHGCAEVCSRAVEWEMPRSPEMRGVLPSVGITREPRAGWGGTLLPEGGRGGAGVLPEDARLRRLSDTHHLHWTRADLDGRASACAKHGWARVGDG